MADPHEIERYLHGEMAADEQENFEERLFADDALYYEVVAAEDELADRYATGDSTAGERVRFEKSFASIPSRRTKVANAAALRRSLSGRRLAADKKEARVLPSAFGRPILAWSLGALLVAATIASVMLFVENRRQASELVRLQLELSNANAAELERDLTAAIQRENELRSQIDGERTLSGDLTAELETERSNRMRLEREIAALRNLPKPQGTSEPPSIEAVTLKPGLGGGDESLTLKVRSSLKRISMLLTLPSNIEANARVSIQLNGRPIAADLPVRVDPSGAKSVAVSIPSADLQAGKNTLTAHANGEQVGAYTINAEEAKQ